jgi:hypothetical protein
MSRRRTRVNTGSTNLQTLGPADRRTTSGGDFGSGALPLNQRELPSVARATAESQARAAQRLVFPPRVKSAAPTPDPAYPPLKNVHVVPEPVDYDDLLGFASLRNQKVRTKAELSQKQRRGRLPGLTATDLDGDGVIDTAEIRLAAVMRDLEGAQGMSYAEKVHAGRVLLAKELLADLDDMEYARMGKLFQFAGQPREAVVNLLADDPNFREHYGKFLTKKATAKLQSSSRAQAVLQQMHAARLQAEEQHAASRAQHERNIWQASESRAAELARNIRTADRFRQATEGYSSLSSYTNFLARNREVSLSRINHMRP